LPPLGAPVQTPGDGALAFPPARAWPGVVVPGAPGVPVGPVAPRMPMWYGVVPDEFTTSVSVVRVHTVLITVIEPPAKVKVPAFRKYGPALGPITS